MRRFYQKILLGWSLGHSNIQNTAGHTALAPGRFKSIWEGAYRKRTKGGSHGRRD